MGRTYNLSLPVLIGIGAVLVALGIGAGSLLFGEDDSSTGGAGVVQTQDVGGTESQEPGTSIAEKVEAAAQAEELAARFRKALSVQPAADQGIETFELPGGGGTCAILQLATAPDAQFRAEESNFVSNPSKTLAVNTDMNFTDAGNATGSACIAAAAKVLDGL